MMNNFTSDIQHFDSINNTVVGTSVVGTAGNDTISNSSSGNIPAQYNSGDGSIVLDETANLNDLNTTGDYTVLAETFVESLQYKTEAGYPLIAGLFFHPEEYHGFKILGSSYYADSETLTINSSDGLQLTGYHYTPENPNDKWVILVHGYGHNHKHMNGFARQYLTNNYHVLMVDQRAAGDSEGEWLTMGAAEGEDVALWTHKIAELNPNAKITLHGVSMGAATAMLAAANSNLTNVTSLVEDCGYTRVLALVDMVKGLVPELGDPKFVNLVSNTSESLTGYNLTAAAPIDSLSNATMPSMFITGTADQVISPSMLNSLYSASGAEVKEIFTVEGATHGVSGLKDSIGYGNAVFRFNAEAAGEGWITSNITDSISLRGTKYDDTITSSGNYVTITGGTGDDTITNSGSNNTYIYKKGDGDDVIDGITTNDTLVIDGAKYNSTIIGNDKFVSIDGSENVITLKDAATITPIIISKEHTNYYDKDGNEIENPVAQIEIDSVTYYYESVARATNDADNNSTVTVTANSTETSTINASKGLTIQFAESGLGVYSVTGGNFISSDDSKASQFSISSNRVLSNSNSLMINDNATATLDGYAVTGTSNGYAFALQDNSFTLNNVSYNGIGSATFDIGGNVSLTNGAIITTNDTAGQSFTFNGAGTFKLNTKTVINSAESLNVTNTADGLIIGENVYKINDSDNAVTFITNSNGEVSDITNFSGSLNTTAQNVTVNGAAFNTNDTSVTISSAGTGISQIDGVGNGDVLNGDIDAAKVLVTVSSESDRVLWSLNNRNYILTGDNDGVQVTGNKIDGLDNAASLEVGSAGNYIVNNTSLNAKTNDTIIGTAEGSAYIFDPDNASLNIKTMSDDEIISRVGISTNYSTCETDTEKTAALITDTNKLNGNMELALNNSDTTTAQTADFSNSTGKKKITLEGGSQEVKFNDGGDNVVIIENDSVGEKNITLGNGGDLVIIKGTSTSVNITAGIGEDTIVTSGNNVTVGMKSGVTKIVPNGGNVNLTNYDASTGAGIQFYEVSDIERAVQNGNINFGNGVVSSGGATVTLGGSGSKSTTVNLFDNRGSKTKVGYTHSDGGTIDTTDDNENVLLIGNNNSTKSNGSSLKAGRGNDVAFGGAGDFFDLGSGNNRVYLNSNRGNGSKGATVAMTATSGKTEVYGFNAGFDNYCDKIAIDIANAKPSLKGGVLTFSIGDASLILHFESSSADLIADDNFIGETANLSDIMPITYESGDYQNIYDSSNNSLDSGVQITFAGA